MTRLFGSYILLILFIVINEVHAETISSDSFPVHYPLIDSLNLSYEIDKSIVQYCEHELANPNLAWFDKSVLFTNYFASSINLFYPIHEIKAIWKRSYDNEPYTSCQYVEKEYRKMPTMSYKNNIPWPLHCVILRERTFFEGYCSSIHLHEDSSIIRQLLNINEVAYGDAGSQLVLDEIVNRIKKFPGRSTVGVELEYIPWKIVQNGDLKYLEKYLGYLTAAVDAHDLHPRYLAFTRDKIQVLKGEPQWYGTQSHYIEGKEELYPIKDGQNVDKLRAEMGLYPIKGSRSSLGDIIVEQRKNQD